LCFVVRLAGLRVCGVGAKGCPPHVARARFAFVLPGLLAHGLSRFGVSRAGGLAIGRRPQPSAHCGASQAALSFLRAASQRGCRSNYSVKRTPVNRLRSSKRCGRRRLPQALGGRCSNLHFRGGSSQHAAHGTHQHQSSFGRHRRGRGAHSLRRHRGCFGQHHRQYQARRVCYVYGAGGVASFGIAANVRAPPSNYSFQRTRCARR